MSRLNLTVLFLIAAWICSGMVLIASPAPRTQALVVGTIHDRHARNENYSYADVVHILATYDPDLICVEIRPQDFRREPYLKEMMLATVWGLSHGKKVAPIDWWNDAPNDRQIRAGLVKQPEYVEKEKQLQLLRAQSPVIARYEKLYGPEDKENQWGAQRSDAIGMIFRESSVPVLVGVVVGLVSAFFWSLFLGSLLYGVDSFDLGSPLLAVTVMLAAALLAAAIPARRATNVNPIVTLRYE